MGLETEQPERNVRAARSRASEEALDIAFVMTAPRNVVPGTSVSAPLGAVSTKESA
jgi:hypothetical protein